MGTLDRRSFLRLGSGLAAAGAFGLTLPSVAQAQSTQHGPASTGRTLVVIDLQGGNDALNTFVPDSGLYQDLRPSIALLPDELLRFDGLSYGVHPALEPLKRFWDADQLTALYGTGLPGQGRSHFVAQDAWRSARPGEPARSGWLGRWLEATQGADDVPLRAVALGQSTLAAQGETGRPVAIQSVSGFQLRPPNDNRDVTAAVLAMNQSAASGLLAQVQRTLPDAVDAVSELQDLVAGVQIDEGTDVDVDADAALFRAATAIIAGNVGTQVLYVTVNGFDTHSLQGPKQDVLLQLVARGLDEMFETLQVSGHADDTLVLIVSEFGRRVAENGSLGTDHGQGGLSFLIGPAVTSSQVIGEPDLHDLVNGDLQITIDARTMYDSALRWLGAPTAVVQDVLGGRWNDLDLLQV